MRTVRTEHVQDRSAVRRSLLDAVGGNLKATVERIPDTVNLLEPGEVAAARERVAEALAYLDSMRTQCLELVAALDVQAPVSSRCPDCEHPWDEHTASYGCLHLVGGRDRVNNCSCRSRPPRPGA